MKDQLSRLAPLLLLPVAGLFVMLMNACAAPAPEPTEGKGENNSALVGYRSEGYNPNAAHATPGGYGSEGTKMVAPTTNDAPTTTDAPTTDAPKSAAPSAGDDDDDDCSCVDDSQTPCDPC